MTDTTNTTADTTPMARLWQLSTEHRARLNAEADAQRQTWEAMRREREAAERRQVASDARVFVRTAFPRTLSQAVGDEDWQGYPAVADHLPPLPPCAVAYLGHGHLAHYTTDAYGAGQVTLVRPCECGNFEETVADGDTGLTMLLERGQRSMECIGVCTEHFPDVVVGEGPW